MPSVRELRSRPDRFALLALAMALVALLLAAATADAGGGITADGDGDRDGALRTGGDRYERIWEGYSDRAKRWARRTSRCESGGDPRAVSPDGTYRGAFQFMRSTWRNSPRSPGGDPIRYRWRTQAVVAVSLKRRDGAHHWPNCG